MECNIYSKRVIFRKNVNDKQLNVVIEMPVNIPDHVKSKDSSVVIEMPENVPDREKIYSILSGLIGAINETKIDFIKNCPNDKFIDINLSDNKTPLNVNAWELFHDTLNNPAEIEIDIDVLCDILVRHCNTQNTKDTHIKLS